jgi:OOP family OmpA-OmpF porin
MKKKLLCFALLAGLGMAQAAAAQTYDDRWYVGAGAGVFAGDKDRDISDEVYGMVGVGKMVTPNIAIDAELFHTNPDINLNVFPPDFGDITGRKWELTSLSIVGRYFFINDERKWAPYIVAGIGAQEHHDGTIVFHTFPEPGFNPSRTGTDVNFMLGIGAQFDVGYPYIRTELGMRYDTDDGGDDEDRNGFYDYYAGFEFIFPIGPEAVAVVAPPPAPEPPAKTCADMDDDGDGVNNCDDKCPAQAGVAPDGCPAPEAAPPPKPFRG